MVSTVDQQRVCALLTEAVTVICKNGLTFNNKFCIEGLLGITLDDRNMFLVNIKESILKGGANTANQNRSESMSKAGVFVGTPPMQSNGGRGQMGMGQPRGGMTTAQQQMMRRRPGGPQTQVIPAKRPMPGQPGPPGMSGGPGHVGPGRGGGPRGGGPQQGIPQDEDFSTESETNYSNITATEKSSSALEDTTIDLSDSSFSLHPFVQQQNAALHTEETLDDSFSQVSDRSDPFPSPHLLSGCYFDQPLRFKKKERYTSVEEALVRQPGPVVIARVFARKYRNLTMSMITSAMTNLTTEPGTPSYIGQYKVVSGGTKVFFKCPPTLLHPQALETYGLTAQAYQETYDLESDAPGSSGPRDWRNFVRKVMEVSPFAEVLASLNQWNTTSDSNLAAEDPTSLSSPCVPTDTTSPIQIKTEVTDLPPDLPPFSSSPSDIVGQYTDPTHDPGQHQAPDQYHLGAIKTEAIEEDDPDTDRDDNFNLHGPQLT